MLKWIKYFSMVEVLGARCILPGTFLSRGAVYLTGTLSLWGRGDSHWDPFSLGARCILPGPFLLRGAVYLTGTLSLKGRGVSHRNPFS